jgi:drug/metabolite transporter (DMT)-like permease
MASSCALLWGFLAIVMKVVAEDVDPITIVWFRFAFAFSSLVLIIGWRDRRSLRILGSPPLLGWVAAVALTANYIGYVSGLALTTPSFAQVLIQTAPLMFAMIGVVFFKERLSVLQMRGVLLALAGFAIFYFDQYQAEVVPRETMERGILILTGAAVAWATYAAIQKVLVGRGHAPQQLNLLLYVFPAVVMIPWVNFETLAGLSPQLWALMVFLGANTLLAYGALGEALKRLPAYQVSLILTCNPLITLGTLAALAALEVSWIPADSVGWKGYGAALLVVLGVGVVLRRPVAKPGPLKS